MRKAKRKHCVICSEKLEQNKWKYCSAACRGIRHKKSSDGLSAAESGVIEKKVKQSDAVQEKGVSGLAQVEKQARMNGRTYGVEAMQEYLAEQRVQMEENRRQFCNLQYKRQAERVLALWERKDEKCGLS